MQKFSGKYILAAVSACSLVGASIGLLVNVAGVFFTPMAEALGVGRGSVSLSLTISTLIYAVGGLVAPKMIRVSTYRKWLILCALIVSASTVLISFSNNLIVLYMFSAIRGFFAGFTGPVLMSILVNNWFYEKSALVNSIAMGFSGLVGAVFSPILTSIISHWDWRIGTITNAALLLIFYLPAILLPVGYIPEAHGLSPYGAASSKDGQTVHMDQIPIIPILVVLLTIFAAIGPFCTAYPPHFPGMAENYGLPTAVGATMLSVCMITNSGGKLIFGIASEKLGNFLSILIYIILSILGLLSILFFPSSWMLYIGAALTGAVYTLGSVAIVVATRDLVGLNNYNKVYPKIYTIAIIVNAISGSAIGFMYDQFKNYRIALTIAIILLCGMIITLIAAYRIRRRFLVVKE
ncbi:MAG: MFS transporter [Firmicutes bacterium]|nr:MFS transporter [Bacillota bacterium]